YAIEAAVPSHVHRILNSGTSLLSRHTLPLHDALPIFYRFKKVRTIVDRDTKESETSMARVKSNEYVLRYYVDNPDTPIDHGIYVQVGDDLESKIKLMNSSFIEREVKSTIYSIKTSADIVLPEMNGHIIPTLHGMYDTKKDELIEYSEDYINTKKIPVE